MFNLLSSRSTSVTKIPQYTEEDSIDLQIKSLLYAFKRLRIQKFSSFYKQDAHSKQCTLKYIDGTSSTNSDTAADASGSAIPPPPSPYYEKLDATYNIEELVDILVNDEYRVMIDFGKNKFRSLCIISDYPSANLSRPGSPVKGEAASANTNGPFPPLIDEKDRISKRFGFIYLPLVNLTSDVISNVLAHSHIYSEYAQIGVSSRYQYASESVDDVVGTRAKGGVTFSISRAEHGLIIRKYLTKLAFNVQLSRIFEEYVKQMQSQLPIQSSPTRLSHTDPSVSSPRGSPQSSPTRANTLSRAASSSSLLNSQTPLTKLDTPKLAQPPSRSTSPTRTLKSKPSISKLRLGELYTAPASTISPNYTSPPTPSTSVFGAPTASSETPAGTGHASVDPATDKRLTLEVRLQVWEKCKNAVKDKLLRERKLLAQLKG